MSYNSVILADSPVSYWKLNETSGTTATDSADANNGTYNGSYTLNNGAPATAVDNSVLFNGSTGYVSIPDATNIHLVAPLSLEAWIKTTSVLVSNLSILAKYAPSAPNAGYALGVQSGKFQIWVGDATNGWFSSIRSVNDGVWHHVVATLSGTTVTLYIDGVLDSTATRTPSLTSTTQLTIANSSANIFFPGAISSVAVYNVALTSTQVTNHFNASGNPKVRVSQAGLLAVTQGTPKVRVSQEGLLAVVQGNPKVRVSQVGLLAIVTLRSGNVIRVPLNGLNINSDFTGGMNA